MFENSAKIFATAFWTIGAVKAVSLTVSISIARRRPDILIATEQRHLFLRKVTLRYSPRVGYRTTSGTSCYGIRSQEVL